ncbi:MAG: hypothetical protein KC516_01655 [Nanoarchaeota archaeon]|nr:hypothetical protein [Nanoarchaeota archaeon]
MKTIKDLIRIGIGDGLETVSYSHFTVVGKDNGQIQMGFDEGTNYWIGSFNPEEILFNEDDRVIEAKPIKVLFGVEITDNRYKEIRENPVPFYDKYVKENIKNEN